MRTWKWVGTLISLLVVIIASYAVWSIRQHSLQMHEITFGPPIGNPWYEILPRSREKKYSVTFCDREVIITNRQSGKHWTCKAPGHVYRGYLSANKRYMAIIYEVNAGKINRQVYCSLFEHPGRLRGYFRVPDNPSINKNYGVGEVYPSVDGHAVLYQRWDKSVPGGLRQAIFVQ